MIQRVLSLLIVGSTLAWISGCASDHSTPQSSAPAASGRAAKLASPPNFTSKGAGFSIWFPSKVTDQKHTSDETKWGKVETFIIQAKTESLTYIVVSRSIPSGVDTSNPAQFIDGVQEGFLEAGAGKVEQAEDIDRDGIPGRELLISPHEGPTLTRLRIYFSPHFSFQVMAVGLKESIVKKKTQIDKVFDSFRLAE